MPRHVAFLRAINVGGHTVKMDRLRLLFEDLGLARVETFIASGNVLFDAPARGIATLERRIERAVAESLGFPAATFIRSARELHAIVARDPFSSAPPAALYVGILGSVPSTAVASAVVALSTATDRFVVDGRALYWGCHSRFSDSPFSGATLERTLGMPVTMRSINTVARLSARLAGG